MKDERENIKVQPGVRHLVKVVAAHLGVTQSELIKTLAEEKARELNLSINKF